MTKVSFDDLRKLYLEAIIPFHEIKRDICLPLDEHRPDNDAEHSWSLALMACALAAEVDKELDVGQVTIFAVVHDLVEIYAGDTSVWSDPDQLANKNDREAKALKKIAQNFSAFPGLVKHVQNYESKESAEAKFVYALDKFLNLLNLLEDKGHFYRDLRKITKAQVDEQLKEHREKGMSDPNVAPYYKKLREAFDAHPEYFYK